MTTITKTATKARTTTPKKAAKAVPAAKPVKSVKAPKPAKAPRPVLERQNNVARPAGGKTRRVWDTCDAITTATGATAHRGAVMEALKAEVNSWTIATQYSAWRRFHGIAGRLPKAEPADPVPTAE